MLEHTKKPPTDTVELCFTGPAAKRQEAVNYLRGLGFEARNADSTPWLLMGTHMRPKHGRVNAATLGAG